MSKKPGRQPDTLWFIVDLIGFNSPQISFDSALIDDELIFLTVHEFKRLSFDWQFLN